MKHFYFILLLFNGLLLSAQTLVGSTLYGTTNLENFGKSISMAGNGNRIAIGSPANNDQGSNKGNVKIYDWTNGAWSLVGNIYGPNNSYIGTNVDLSENGNTFIVTTDSYIGTASKNICVYELQNGTWNMTYNQTATSSSNLGFSTAVSDDGNTIAYSHTDIGSSWNSSGKVYVIRKINNIWTEIGLLDEYMIFLNFNSYFGHTVKLSPDGNKIFVSAPKTGTLHSFQYANGQWTRYGGTILETNNSFEQFAKSFSVNTNCDLIAIGNSFYDRSTTSSGAVTFYSLINGIWTKTGQITGAPQAMIGNHVSISDNNVVAVSSIKNNLNQSVSGSLMVYKIDLPNQLYTQLGNTLNAGYNDFLTINDISKTSNKVMTSAVYGANSNNVKTGYVKTFGYEAFLGTSEINAVKSFTVYPNPTKGKIYFDDSENKIDFIKVFNANHQLVLQKKIQPGEAGINLPNQKGLYWVTLHLKDSGSLTKKIIVE